MIIDCVVLKDILFSSSFFQEYTLKQNEPFNGIFQPISIYGMPAMLGTMMGTVARAINTLHLKE